MNKVLNSIRNLLPLRGRIKNAKTEAQLSARPRMDRFTLISWVVTWVIVLGALGLALWKTQSGANAQAIIPQPTTVPGKSQANVEMPTPVSAGSGISAIPRELQLKTNIPERPRYDPITYRVQRGDAMFSIAKNFNIKPESILYSNKDLNDNPEGLKPGLVLTIPPVDGLYYTWQDGDTIESVAEKFKADLNNDNHVDQTDVQLLEQAILDFPGNNLDLTNPVIKPGTVIMIPGGQRELVDWTQYIPTLSRGTTGAGTGTSNIAVNACGGGPVGSGFIWPTNGPHTISGNDYGPTHLGIDITANQGDPILATAAGVVVLAQGGWNYGYGNFVEIDHGNGYASVYAHLSQINVSPCQSVYAGEVIGLAGDTGNAFGAHLHFEIRKGGSNINPHYVVQ